MAQPTDNGRIAIATLTRVARGLKARCWVGLLGLGKRAGDVLEHTLESSLIFIVEEDRPAGMTAPGDVMDR